MSVELGFYTFGDIDVRSGAPEVSAGQRIREVLERVRLAEEVGLHYAGIGEHHRPDYAISAPATVVSAALAQTERIHVGSAVTVLSTEDPVRVYQQFATMDQFSQGRVEMTVGRGSFIESFPLFGVNLNDYDEVFDEKLNLLLTVDAGNPVSWSGRFRPGLQKAQVFPRPADVQGRGEHLTIEIATGGSPASATRAGRLGVPVSFAVIGGEPRQFAPLVERYHASWQKAGNQGRGRVTIAGPGFVAEDSQKARDFFQPYHHATMAAVAAERGFAQPNRISFDAQSGPHGAIFVGDPEYVAEKILTLHQVLGHDRQIFQMDYSGVPQREVLRSIELLGTEVRPRVEAELGSRE